MNGKGMRSKEIGFITVAQEKLLSGYFEQGNGPRFPHEAGNLTSGMSSPST